MALRDVTDQAATRVGGDFLRVPTDETENKTLTKRVRKFDNGMETTISRWEEDAVIDDFKYGEDFDKEAKLEHEYSQLQFRVTDRRPSRNTSKVRTDFGHWFWDLAIYTDQQLEAWASNGSDDPTMPEKKLWANRMQRMTFSSRRMSSFLKALGHQDRLVNRAVFRGLSKIEDLIPTFSGRHVTVVFEAGEDKDGNYRENIVSYKKA